MEKRMSNVWLLGLNYAEGDMVGGGSKPPPYDTDGGALAVVGATYVSPADTAGAVSLRDRTVGDAGPYGIAGGRGERCGGINCCERHFFMKSSSLFRHSVLQSPLLLFG